MNKSTGKYKTFTEERRETYILRLKKATKKGVESIRELSRVSGIPVTTICSYRDKKYVTLRFIPSDQRYQDKLEDAISQEFINHQDFLDYLGWSDSYTRKVADIYGVMLPDFRRVPKPSKRWQSGTIAENREEIDYLLDHGFPCDAIGNLYNRSKHTVWQYKNDREKGLVD